MPVFTITDVSTNVRDWSSERGGPMKEYRVHLNGDGQDHMNVEWSRKATSPAPAPGQQIDGTLEDRGSHGLKFKALPSLGGGGFGRPEDPKRAARIKRMHSQEMALIAIKLAVDIGVEFDAEGAAGFFELITKTANWFDQDAERAAK